MRLVRWSAKSGINRTREGGVGGFRLFLHCIRKIKVGSIKHVEKVGEKEEKKFFINIEKVGD